MAQWDGQHLSRFNSQPSTVKDLTQLWLGSDPWPRNSLYCKAEQPKKKKKRVKSVERVNELQRWAGIKRIFMGSSSKEREEVNGLFKKSLKIPKSLLKKKKKERERLQVIRQSSSSAKHIKTLFLGNIIPTLKLMIERLTTSILLVNNWKKCSPIANTYKDYKSDNECYS